MFILITTANFPDVMLAAYESTPLTTFYFILYLVLGLFLFMNILIAIFYNSYQDYATKDIGSQDKERNEYF
jgi:hypothetical protein